MSNFLWKSFPADMAPHGFQYELRKWHKHKGKVELCESGFHCSENVIDAMGYVSAEILAQVEVRGESDKEDTKQVWSELKIVKAWKWEKKDSVSLAIYAAELVIDNFEKKYPKDNRPRKAIEAAKKVLENDTEKNRSAAWSAARSAARSAESAASAARSAAWSAASAASAARSAASAAWSAAWSAASAASAARSAARSAIKDKCAQFVIERLENKTPIPWTKTPIQK